MSDLDARFEAAAAAAQDLPSKPDNETLLKLYALYKQGTKGDASGKRPGMMDFVGRAKFDAWQRLKGTGKEEAKEQYVALVTELQEEMG
ncbi:MAG TPA: acyl-CoA-binding protein [Anaerolineae bacterium]|nr:acyl-CoA-binding protein [Anaerolineae bacterium]